MDVISQRRYSRECVWPWWLWQAGVVVTAAWQLRDATTCNGNATPHSGDMSATYPKHHGRVTDIRAAVTARNGT